MPDEYEGPLKRSLPLDVVADVRVLKDKVAELESVCRVMAGSINDMLVKLSRDEMNKVEAMRVMANAPTVDEMRIINDMKMWSD